MPGTVHEGRWTLVWCAKLCGQRVRAVVSSGDSDVRSRIAEAGRYDGDV